MRLGTLIPEFPTQTHIFFWREIEALRELGVEVHLLSSRPPKDTCPHQFATVARAQTHYLYPPRALSVVRSLRAAASYPKVAAYLASLELSVKGRARALGYAACAADLLDYARTQQLDHLHVHSCADFAHVAAMCRLMGGPPYSLTLHGDLATYGHDHRQKFEHANFVAAAARTYERQIIEQTGVPPERATTIWMGVDTSRFTVPERPPHDELRLVTVSRLALGKGHAFAFQALRRALDQGLKAHYTVVGQGPDEAKIRASLAENRLEAVVTMRGGLDESEVKKVLESQDAFVLSSVGSFEASPVALMEAMACGLPGVVSIIGGTPDMVTDGVDGFLVAQQDVEGLARAFLKLGTDVALRRRLGAAARERAERTFNSKVVAQKLLDTIRSVPARA